MTSLPLLSSRDGVEIVAALLGHSRRPPPPSSNVAALDTMFEEIVDNLRLSLPRAHIETGANAVASVLLALHDVHPPQRKKRYHQPTPSTHCHVCCRPNTTVRMAVCSNIQEGSCRKAVCSRCIHVTGWSWENAVREGSSWICPHCTDGCASISRAQCWVYKRTNSRRKRNGIRKHQRQDDEHPPRSI